MIGEADYYRKKLFFTILKNMGVHETFLIGVD